jgi:2-polyprenyl-6-methoxyphenol hydroxylase-like FAD-dependent oxidoreductase
MDTEVLIIGAGPTGLTLAIELQRRGIGYRLSPTSGQGMNTGIQDAYEVCEQAKKKGI